MSVQKNEKAMLVILDGWGIGPYPDRSAIAQAQTPIMDNLTKTRPNSTLITYGESVGLPVGQMGNSEVGHMTIGAGQVIPQELLRINRSIKSGAFQNNMVLLEALAFAKKNNKKIHIIGLLSDGGVHSHIEHLKAICDVCNDQYSERVHIHAFMDGRDTSPHSGIIYVEELQKHIIDKNIQISSLVGRYYAMDRDKRWERIKKAYDLLCNSKSKNKFYDPIEALRVSYSNKITDEFIEPTKILSKGANEWHGNIEEGDVVIFFNFRTDRPRQLTEVLTQKANVEYNLLPLSLYFVTMKVYDSNFKNNKVLFKNLERRTNIGEVVSKLGLSQLRIAETEKYAHVSYFLSGGEENPYDGEKRIMVPSPKVATYDLMPQMSAEKVTSSAIEQLKTSQPDLIVLNYANADMVGHTGDFKAAIKAVETVDKVLGELIEVATNNKYSIIIIADHGNSDYMINDDGTAHTAHTTNPVPCIIVSKRDIVQIRNGYLYDVAPTILDLMDIKVPVEMTGRTLLEC